MVVTHQGIGSGLSPDAIASGAGGMSSGTGGLVPNLHDGLKQAVVEGAVTGGGLTVIANAPNPAGQALLGRFFDDAVHPLYLFLGATVPTLVAAALFRLL